MKCFKPLDERIIVFGMSCVGKTTFAKQLVDHYYYCFDSMFQWNMIETLGVSTETNLRHIYNICSEEIRQFVLDGWTLADKKGKFLPFNSKVYVVYAPYECILSQYRIPVLDIEEFRPMYESWYLGIDYEKFPDTRYFCNDGEFFETSRDKFISVTFS